MNAYFKQSKRLDEVLEKSIFWLPNQQIVDFLGISESTRKRLLKDLKDLGLIPKSNLKGLSRNFLEILWEYRQLILKTDSTNAYLQIKSIVKELTHNEQ